MLNFYFVPNFLLLISIAIFFFFLFSLFGFCSNASIKEEYLRQWIWICLWLLLQMVMLPKGLSSDNATSKEFTLHFYQDFIIFDDDHFYDVIFYAFWNRQMYITMYLCNYVTMYHVVCSYIQHVTMKYMTESSVNVLTLLIKTLWT